MQPHEINVTLGEADTRALLGDLTAENRALKTVLAAYITHFGQLPGAAPDEPPEAESPAPAPAPRKLRQGSA